MAPQQSESLPNDQSSNWLDCFYVATTSEELRILQFILGYRKTWGNSPTLRRVGIGLGIAKAEVFRCVRELEKKGVLQRSPRVTRSIELTDPNTASITKLESENKRLREALKKIRKSWDGNKCSAFMLNALDYIMEICEKALEVK